MTDDERTNDAWYSFPGAENDVVLSTRVRLARNLANFPFPQKLSGGDGERVRALLFDAFNRVEDSERYHSIFVNQLDSLGATILQERGVLPERAASERNSGIILRNDGRLACTVNIGDHVHISSFASGLDCDGAFSVCHALDLQLQQSVQFAASYDHGYLTTSLLDAGSGMKLSVRMHLPCLSLQGRLRSVMDDMASKGIAVTACFGAGGLNGVSSLGSRGAALGAFYQLTSTNSFTGSEIDQIAVVASSAKQLLEQERAAREECATTMVSDIKNYLYRSIALARYSLFVPLREAIDLISGIKLGNDLKLVNGIDAAGIHALLYRVQNGHLEFVAKNGTFQFEKDIATNTQKKNDRLRALILQEAFEHCILAL